MAPCLARSYSSFKSYMAENHLDFCINRYLVWIILGNVYNFEFAKYAFSTKVGHIFPKYTSEFISKKIDKKILSEIDLKCSKRLNLNYNYIVFLTFDNNPSNTFLSMQKCNI
jgi:hypothetical protein